MMQKNVMNETRILDGADPAALVEAAAQLRNGGVAVVPTDTVYGLAAGIFHSKAIQRIFDIKQRDETAALPVLLATAADLPLLTEGVPYGAWRLFDRFWPGPLTLTLKARPSVNRLITGGRDTVAVRVPAARSCLELLQVLGEPIIGTSANRSGRPPALTAAAAYEEIGPLVDVVLADDAAVRAGVPSTVVELTERGAVVLREGALSVDQIRQALGAAVHVAKSVDGRSGGRLR